MFYLIITPWRLKRFREAQEGVTGVARWTENLAFRRGRSRIFRTSIFLIESVDTLQAREVLINRCYLLFPMTHMKSQFRSHCSSRRLKTMHWHRIPQGPLCRAWPRLRLLLAAPATDLARDALSTCMDKSIPMLPYHTESFLSCEECGDFVPTHMHAWASRFPQRSREKAADDLPLCQVSIDDAFPLSLCGDYIISAACVVLLFI